jgi:hypothetical protein
MRIPSIKNGTSQKYDIFESGRRVGTVHNASLAAQIVAEIARRDAKAAAEWAVAK